MKYKREKLQKDLNKIKDLIKLKTNEMLDSDEYKLLSKKLKEKQGERHSKGLELYKLKKRVYKKYILNYSSWGGISMRDVKPCIKQGIKRGFGITNVLFINEFDLMYIVKRLIDNDLKKIKISIDKLLTEIEDAEIEIKKVSVGIERKKSEILALENKGLRVYNKLNKKKYLKNKKIEERKKKLEVIINKLRENKSSTYFMKRIINEVNKELILEKIGGNKK